MNRAFIIFRTVSELVYVLVFGYVLSFVTKIKGVPPLASQADAPYFFGEKSKQKRCRHFAAQQKPLGPLRCSTLAAAAKLASLRQLRPCFSHRFRSSAAHRLIKVKIKSQDQHQLLRCRNLIAGEPLVRANRKCGPVFEPLKPIRRNPNLRKALTKELSEFHFDLLETATAQRFQARFFGYFFVARHKKATRISQRSWRRNAVDFFLQLIENHEPDHQPAQPSSEMPLILNLVNNTRMGATL